MTARLLYLIFFPILISTAQADEPKLAQSFLTQHCIGCHGPEKPKGNFRADQLTADFSKEANRELWRAAMKRIATGEMPPKEKPRPAEKDRKRLEDWVTTQTDAAEAKRRVEQGRVVLRRLNRVEYENTIRDLLGIQIDVKDLLPADSSAHGFDNASDSQHVSSFFLETYLEAADAALNVAIANQPQPPKIQKRLLFKDERHVKVTTEKVFRLTDDGLVMFSSSQWQAITVGQFYPPDRGRYRFRISAQAVQSGGKPVAFRVDAGPMLMATKNHLVGYFDAPAAEPKVFEFIEALEAKSTIRILPYGLTSAQAVHKIGADTYEGPGLLINWVEVEGPLHDAWPPASHSRLFGDLKQGPAPVFNNAKRVEVQSKNPEADAEKMVREFAHRAFRRPATEAELKPIFALMNSRLAEKSTFEQAVRVGFKAVLVSPGFLYLREEPGKLDDFALASRLSYFLWSTMPDAELLKLASEKKLGDPTTLRGQVERMLKSPKSQAFVENFTGQWLGLRDIDFTEPSFLLYPEYDPALRTAMVGEAEGFFAEVLKDDLSLMNVVSSDFTMLNARLARHYGIPGVEGWEFRKVKLPKESHRGGVITMASVLKVTANGTSTSPVVRGAWVMERILGITPPKPPADVPALEPDIRGATTIRQQLAKHRTDANCAACHAKIDPPGFALENFDVIGGWRENYRVTGRGDPVTVDGWRMPYQKGPKVDPADQLDDGRKFDIDELKLLLMKDKDRIAAALATKLITYATGAAPAAADRAEVEALVKKTAKDRGLRSLIHEIVQSELFRKK